MNKDLEHLRLLAIFHYVLGGLACCCSCFPIIYVVLGFAMINGDFGPPQNGQAPPPPEFGWIFVVAGSMGMIVGVAFAIALLISGRMLQRRRHYIFCIVMAAIACLNMPFGTVLGVFTLIVLLRPSVKELFERPDWDGSDDETLLRDEY